MYNLHCHSLLSDGVLLPSAIAARYAALGYKVIAITDHADYSNIKQVASSILEFSSYWPKDAAIKIIPGVELTHIPLEQFKPLVKYAREKGIKIIIGHGETLAEPVAKGTNRAALDAGVDILAHPGLICEGDVKLAKKKGIFLEITARAGHSTVNSHVAESALNAGAKLIIDIDSHIPEDIITPGQLIKVGLNAGLSRKEIDKIYQDVSRFIKTKHSNLSDDLV